MKTILKNTICAGAAAAVCLSVGNLDAQVLTGTYSLGGNAVDNGDGTYELTSSPTTYSYVDFTLDQTITFSQLTDLNAVFTSNSGGVAGGSPRLYVDFTDGNYLEIYYGPPGSFAGDDATLNGQSGVNLIGTPDSDTGRYDLTGSGGSFYTTYSAALALDGSEVVSDVAFLTDDYSPLPDRDITLDSIDGTYSPIPAPTVPDQGSTWMLLGGVCAGTFLLRRRFGRA